MFQLPPGWAPHTNPQYAGTHAYEIANPSNVQPYTAFAGQQFQPPMPQQPAPAAYAPPTQYGGYPQQPQGYPQPQGYGAAPMGYAQGAPASPAATSAGLPAYAGMNTQAWLHENEAEEREARGWGPQEQTHIWLDLDKVEKPGDLSEMTVRLLPDIFPVPGQAGDPCIVNARHRVFAEYVPDAQGNRRVYHYNCFHQPGGPGDCPMEKAIDIVSTSGIQGAAEHVKNFKAEVSNVWQGINLDDPSQHWVQVVDPSGAPVIDPMTGQPTWKQVPGFVRMKRTLQDAMREIIRTHGDIADPHHGRPIRLSKKRTGTGQMQVDYNAIALDRCPLDPQLYGIAHAARDLRKDFGKFVEREKLQAIAENILRRFGLGWQGKSQVGYGGGHPGVPGPAPGGWPQHPGPSAPPGTTYNPATGAVRPGGAPQGLTPPGPYAPPGAPSPGYPQPQPQQTQYAPPAQPQQAPPPPGYGPPAPGGYSSPPMGAPPPPSPPGYGPPPGQQPQHAPPPPGYPAQGAPPGPYGPPPGGPPRPGALPPPGAPGLAGGPPPGLQGLPGLGGPPMGQPPPPPGMPPGTHPQAAPPPPAHGPPGYAPPPPGGGGLTPEQLEQQLAGGPPQPGKSPYPF